MRSMEDLYNEIALAQTRESYQRAKVLLGITEDLYSKMLDCKFSMADLSKRTGIKKRRLKRFFAGDDDMKVRDVVKVAFALGLVLDVKLRSRHESTE